MKTIGIIVIVLILIVAVVLIFSPRAPGDVQSLDVKDSMENGQTDSNFDQSNANIELSEFSFVGYGPGKSHLGKFENYEVSKVNIDEKGNLVSGKLIIQANSVTTDTAMLTQHLCEKDNFFDCVKYPTIEFNLINVSEKSAGVFQVSGDLKIKDISKQVSFDVNANSDKTFNSEFKLRMTDFGFSAPGIVDDEVLVKIGGRVM